MDYLYLNSYSILIGSYFYLYSPSSFVFFQANFCNKIILPSKRLLIIYI